MALVVDVPLNTMLADLDETLRVLLKRELARHGFDGVEVAFDAPARDWSSQLSGPTVNLFLYDLRESHEFRPTEWREDRSNGGHREVRPPMIMECSYAVTAWTQAVEDEHRLLSQVLGVLFAFPQLPADVLAGRLAETAQRFAIEGRIGQPKSDGKADFWSAVGGQYKASLDYVVTLACESGVAYERGPEVRTQTMGARISDGPSGGITEMHRFGGKVLDRDGEPLQDAWVTLPDLGLFASSDRSGRFILQRVPPGTHKLVARTREGAEATAEIAVPGAVLDLTVAPAKRGAKKGG
jgi:Pvc16 N-terminal domain/Carboxypeptidase regulatory-like domain